MPTVEEFDYVDSDFESGTELTLQVRMDTETGVELSRQEQEQPWIVTPPGLGGWWGLVGPQMNERVTTLTPKQARKPLSRLCWIGTTSRGLLVIELRNPLCISGASLTSVPDGAGRLPFTFLAQSDRPGDVNLPARLYWWKEETHDTA